MQSSFTRVCALVLGCWSLTAAADPATPDFARDVQPIFKKHCYECHGPTKHRNGYRLDRRSAALSGMVRHNIIPGSSDASRLYRRVLDSRFGPQMPPEEVLAPEDIETLRRWIDGGAPWPDELANESDLPPPRADAVRLAALIRRSPFDSTSRRQAMAMVRADKSLVNARGIGGTTPLMEAALNADAPLLKAWLDAGGDPNIRNDRGATALMWAIDDVAKTRLLLERGADPNVASDFGQTALMRAAAGTDSATVVAALLERGAEATQASLNAAARANPQALRVLLTRVPDKNGAAAVTALRNGCLECLALLDRHSKAPLPPALSALLPVAGPGDERLLKLGLERGPDFNSRDGKGRTPLMQAAISELAPPDFVHELIRRGADPHAISAEGLNALDYALRLGRAPFIEELRRAGVVPTAAAETLVSVAPLPGNDVRAAVARSIPLLQSSGVKFYDQGGCVSCHHNLLGIMTTRVLSERNLAFDAAIAARELRVLVEDIENSRDQALQGIVVPGGATTTTGYLLASLGAVGHPPDPATDALVRLLRRAQWPEGRWMSPVRPPSEASDFTATALGMRGIQLYGDRRNAADRRAISRAAQWLRAHTPRSNEDRVFRLWGLTWSGVPARERRAAMTALLDTQRADGGWSQLDYRDSDAYATGQALVALHDAGLSPASEAYQRGVKFLLDTQLADGSWLVRTRSHVTQIYFESGFPHGAHQFISAAATHWATQALALTVVVMVPGGESGEKRTTVAVNRSR